MTKNAENCKRVFYVFPFKEDIFLTTFCYGLYFSSDVIHFTNFHILTFFILPSAVNLLYIMFTVLRSMKKG